MRPSIQRVLGLLALAWLANPAMAQNALPYQPYNPYNYASYGWPAYAYGNPGYGYVPSPIVPVAYMPNAPTTIAGLAALPPSAPQLDSPVVQAEPAPAAPKAAAPPAAVASPAPSATIVDAPIIDGFNGSASRGGRFKADVGFLVLTPIWSSNPSLTILNETLVVGTAVSSDSRDFNFNAQFVPQVSLGGVLSGGIGIRASWWGFATGAHDSAIAGPGQLVVPAGSFFVGAFAAGGNRTDMFARLSMNVWDLEFTDDFRLGYPMLNKHSFRGRHSLKELEKSFFIIFTQGPEPALGTILQRNIFGILLQLKFK